MPAYKKGIEFPNPDFAALTDVCGGYGFKATKPGELETAISEAFKVDGPAIIDAVVPADEMPNLSTYRPGDGRPFRHSQDQRSRPHRHSIVTLLDKI